MSSANCAHGARGAPSARRARCAQLAARVTPAAEVSTSGAALPQAGGSQRPARPREAPVRVGEAVELTCDSLAFGGQGVCRAAGGYVVLVDRALPGERLRARVTRLAKGHAEAVKEAVLQPHTHAAAPPCPHFGPCGGCLFQNLAYEAQLAAKQAQVADALARIAKVGNGAAAAAAAPPPLLLPIVPCEPVFHYRNKMEFSFSRRAWQPLASEAAAASPGQTGQQASTASGAPAAAAPAAAPPPLGMSVLGLHRAGSHEEVVPISACWLQHADANRLLRLVARECERLGLEAYDPATGAGLLEHLALRRATPRGAGGAPELMVHLTTRARATRQLARLAAAIAAAEPHVVSIVNSYPDDTASSSAPAGATGGDERGAAGRRANQAGGWRRPPPARLADEVLHGRGHLVERLCGLEFEVSARSFFQTNTRQAEVLYGLVAAATGLREDGSDVLLDLYCGTGTIGLSLASRARELVGFELSPGAAADAARNAARNGILNARFVAGDLGALAAGGDLNALAPSPNIVIADPGRSGMAPSVLRYLRACPARRLVYVSCNPATQARDIAVLCAPAGNDTARSSSASSSSLPGSSSSRGSRQSSRGGRRPTAAGRGGRGSSPPGSEGPAAERPYILRQAQACDMFPHTAHVECVAVLDRV